MTKKQLRIAVAKDVLAQLKAEKLKITPGDYVTLPDTPDALGSDSKEIAAAAQTKYCSVCALGATFISLVKLDNKYDFGFFKEVSSGDLFDRVKTVFSETQIQLIECAFETNFYCSQNGLGGYAKTALTSEQFGQAHKFAIRHEGNPRKRLAAIMRNIVRNDGTFVLPKASGGGK